MFGHDPNPIRYAIYTRQSVEKLADFSSCEAQFHTCRDFVNAFNDPRLHWCGQRFDDEGQSGATSIPTENSPTLSPTPRQWLTGRLAIRPSRNPRVTRHGTAATRRVLATASTGSPSGTTRRGWSDILPHDG